jgi:Zn-finger domain-containing protein
VFEEVCKYIGVTFRLNNEYDIKWIRNKLMHAKREEKEKAEELAEKYASRLGDEIIQAIKKIIEESGLTT